jgi:iron complex outermembrane receptor protein
LLSDNFETIKNVWFTFGGGIVATPRNFTTVGQTFVSGTNPQVPVTETPTLSNTEVNLVPRLGLRWDVDPDLQLFTSYGGNVEPPEDWAGGFGPYSGTTATTYPNYGILNLKNQLADTAEVGLRGRYGIFQGSADFFHANVSDELLTIFDPVLNINTTINAPPVVHQGVEAELDTLLWQSGPGDYWSENPQVARLHLVQTYDWSDFHFTGGQFGHNTEPGLPEHYYQGELAFDHPSGFYANIDARVSSSVWVDYKNTFKAAPYAVFGLTAGWQQPRADKKGWQLSLSVDNLTNTKYAVAVAPVFSAGGVDVANEYPGEGIGVFSVVDYKF